MSRPAPDSQAYDVGARYVLDQFEAVHADITARAKLDPGLTTFAKHIALARAIVERNLNNRKLLRAGATQ